MQSIGQSTLNTEDFNMKKIFTSIWNFLEACGRAKYAAELARNGKVAQAQAMYKD